MTIFGTDLIVMLAVVTGGLVVGYLLVFSRLKAMIIERQLKIADQLGTLNDAISALETRLAEHQFMGAPTSALDQSSAIAEDAGAHEIEESGEIAPEIQAAIAAATVAVLGPDATVQSVKPALSPWSQQGRVMVQGGHNFRVRR